MEATRTTIATNILGQVKDENANCKGKISKMCVI